MSRPVFKRTLGVKPATFYNMLQVLEQREESKRKTGRPAKLTLKDQLVLALLFWREYRTYHHMALDWEVEETTVRRTVERVEDTLLASGQFSLPGRKALTEDLTLEVVVVDVSETPCERPKKSGPAREVPQLGQDTEGMVQRKKEATHAQESSDCRSREQANPSNSTREGTPARL